MPRKYIRRAPLFVEAAPKKRKYRRRAKLESAPRVPVEPIGVPAEPEKPLADLRDELNVKIVELIRVGNVIEACAQSAPEMTPTLLAYRDLVLAPELATLTSLVLGRMGFSRVAKPLAPEPAPVSLAGIPVDEAEPLPYTPEMYTTEVSMPPGPPTF